MERGCGYHLIWIYRPFGIYPRTPKRVIIRRSKFGYSGCSRDELLEVVMSQMDNAITVIKQLFDKGNRDES